MQHVTLLTTSNSRRVASGRRGGRNAVEARRRGGGGDGCGLAAEELQLGTCLSLSLRIPNPTTAPFGHGTAVVIFDSEAPDLLRRFDGRGKYYSTMALRFAVT